MKVIVAPNKPGPEDYTKTSRWVFLAGGITNCEEWELEVIDLLRGYDNLTLFRPRRPNYDVSDPAMEDEQIEWEHRFLCESDVILFWFPEETLCPITLFELGSALGRRAKIVVGCHPNYKRKRDVIKQVWLEDGWVQVRDNIPDLVEDLKEKLGLE